MTQDSDATFPPVSPIRAGLLGRCPRCGRGRLFSGFLAVAPRCGHCGLDFSFASAGDGPAVFVTLIAGFIVAGGALAVEVLFEPPIWAHALIWLPLGVLAPLMLLRPAKGLLITLQYHNRAEEGRLSIDGR